MSNSSAPLHVRWIGRVPYREALALQSGLFERGVDQHLLLLEHPHVFTYGHTADLANNLRCEPADVGADLVEVQRGGDITYHGPGQLVAYVLLDIKRRKLGVRELVTLIEQVIIQALAPYGIAAYAKADAPGVYVQEQKVASLGLRVRKGCTFHGLALNVNMDLSPFSRINPCGYAGMQMIQSKDYGGPATMQQAKADLSRQFVSQLAVTELYQKTGFYD